MGCLPVLLVMEGHSQNQLMPVFQVKTIQTYTVPLKKGHNGASVLSLSNFFEKTVISFAVSVVIGSV